MTILYYLKKRLVTVSGVFNIVWMLCLGMACLSLWGINQPSWTVVLLSCCAMILFIIPSLVKMKTLKIKDPIFRFKYLQNGNVIKNQTHYCMFLFHIVAYVFSVSYFIKVIPLLLSGNYYLIRNNAFSGNIEFASTSALFIFQSIVAPLFVSTIIIAIMDLFNRVAKKSTIIFALLDLMLYTLLFAGRYMLFETVIFTVLVLCDNNRNKNFIRFFIQHKDKIFSVALLIALIILISIKRSNSSFFESLYLYFCGSFSYLSYLIDNEVCTDFYLLGKAQFGFIYNLYSVIKKVVFNMPYEGSNHIITQLTSTHVHIGGGHYYNSLGTFLHDFIADYGLWGSLFGVLVFSYICHYIEKIKSLNENYFNRSIYYYIMFVIVNTVLGYSLRSQSFVFVVLFCWIFSLRKGTYVKI